MKTNQNKELKEIEKFQSKVKDPLFTQWLSDFESFKKNLLKSNPQLKINFFQPPDEIDQKAL